MKTLTPPQTEQALRRMFGTIQFQEALRAYDVSADDIADLFGRFVIYVMKQLDSGRDMSKQVAWICDHWKDWSKQLDNSGIQERAINALLKQGNAALLGKENPHG